MLENAAREPEVEELARVLNKMGARSRAPAPTRSASRASTSCSGVEHALIPDRIEAGTFMVAAAITGGDVLLAGRRARAPRRGRRQAARSRRRRSPSSRTASACEAHGAAAARST